MSQIMATTSVGVTKAISVSDTSTEIIALKCDITKYSKKDKRASYTRENFTHEIPVKCSIQYSDDVDPTSVHGKLSLPENVSHNNDDVPVKCSLPNSEEDVEPTSVTGKLSLPCIGKAKYPQYNSVSAETVRLFVLRLLTLW